MKGENRLGLLEQTVLDMKQDSVRSWSRSYYRSLGRYKCVEYL